ncbi:hypothetical protein EBU99_05735 [bacterium]|nr:hypothetical protein [bacterium]
MAKDLRALLEAPQASSGGKGNPANAPLAQRRSLSSPGDPRVFRVRSGFVCGLCGRLHSKIEGAFDCLGRCTIELRLRSPVGPTNMGDLPHYACTACGRGFVNTDDAEQCFERCIIKMKPNPKFELALRRVQARYVHRLASHGVRSLERIDPLTEHTKMLTTLTQEKGALGFPAASGKSQASLKIGSPAKHPGEPKQAQELLSPPEQHAFESAVVALEVEQLQEENFPEAGESSSHETATIQEEHPEQLEDTTVQSPSAGGDSNQMQEFAADQPSQDDSQQLIESAESSAQELTSEESAQSSELTQDVGFSEVATEVLETAPLLDDAELTQVNESSALKEVSESENSLDNIEAMLTAVNNVAAVVANATAQNKKPAPQTTPLTNPREESRPAQTKPSGSALSVLVASTPEALKADQTAQAKANAKPAEEAIAMATQPQNTRAAEPEPARLDHTDDFTDFSSPESDSLSNAFAEASEFAQVAVQPDESLALGADVLALLQAPPDGEDLNINKKQEQILKDKTIKIDDELLNSMMDTKQDEGRVTAVFVRKADMKSYRRNNAKYGCSACGTEFFTKEQVEACFYAHPEEGSEEERILLEKVSNLGKKSAA